MTAARDAGVNLAFFSGNDVYWKTRWEPSQDGTNTANRTLVCYKDTWADTQDRHRVEADAHLARSAVRRQRLRSGERPDRNAVPGELSRSGHQGQRRRRQAAALAEHEPGVAQSAVPRPRWPPTPIGYESNEDVDNGFRPAGLDPHVHHDRTDPGVPDRLRRSTVVPGTTTHHLTQYRAASGALVFSAGTIQWAWGLDSNHDGADVQPADPRMRQATANILADMGALPTTLADGLVHADQVDGHHRADVHDHPAGGRREHRRRRPGHRQGHRRRRRRRGRRRRGLGRRWGDLPPGRRHAPLSYTGVADRDRVPTPSRCGPWTTPPTLQRRRPSSRSTTTCPCSIFGALTADEPARAGRHLGSHPRHQVHRGGRRLHHRHPFLQGRRQHGDHVGSSTQPTAAVLARRLRATRRRPDGRASTSQRRSGRQGPDLRRRVQRAERPLRRRHSTSSRTRATHRADDRARRTATTTPTASSPTATPSRPAHYKQTNYYVDAVYNTVDTTPLTVTKVTPDRATRPRYRPTPRLTATFSRAIDPVESTSSSSTPATTRCPGSTTYDDGDSAATFTPTAAAWLRRRPTP